MSSQISKVLIANRGEIACRVMKTARRLGMRTVAVYSEADAGSRHVQMADEAHLLGPPPSGQSYLRGDRVLEAAKISGAQAVHPGYGFLSENVEFAELCAKEGVIFVGPPASAIRDMGIKSTSKQIMSDANVPIIGGYHGEDQSLDKLKLEAEKIGFPVMIKAVRGGGGKGMRIAMTEAEFEEQLESAKREAMKSFGDEVMLLEKYVVNPRHVEVQVFGDAHDNYVYLFERDCSVQRRHQKIIEEAPGPGITPEIRRQLGEAAVRAARAVGYVGAGTVEFVMDKDFNFFFMEMNTRLQVEHPVSEMITGTDLVEWQLRAAAGEKLPVTQDDLRVNGWSFEARIYAEDPDSDFMPGAGPLLHLKTPAPSSDVRIETGVRQGDEVSVHYDPMIAKLVVWGPDRAAALLKLRTCLAEFNVDGLSTNINFLMDLAAHPAFVAGEVDTDFIPRHKAELFTEREVTDRQVCEAAMAVVLADEANILKQRPTGDFSFNDPFGLGGGSRIGHSLDRKIDLKFGGKDKTARVVYRGNGAYSVTVGDGGRESFVRANVETNATTGRQELVCSVDGAVSRQGSLVTDDRVRLFGADGSVDFSRGIPKFVSSLGGHGDDAAGGDAALAPMPGTVEAVSVAPGQEVKKGDAVAVMIAMKMEYVLRASRDGVVERVSHKQGDFVKKGTPIVVLKKE